MLYDLPYTLLATTLAPPGHPRIARPGPSFPELQEISESQPMQKSFRHHCSVLILNTASPRVPPSQEGSILQ